VNNLDGFVKWINRFFEELEEMSRTHFSYSFFLKYLCLGFWRQGMTLKEAKWWKIQSGMKHLQHHLELERLTSKNRVL